jgi:hypothetical protein
MSWKTHHGMICSETLIAGTVAAKYYRSHEQFIWKFYRRVQPWI